MKEHSILKRARGKGNNLRDLLRFARGAPFLPKVPSHAIPRRSPSRGPLSPEGLLGRSSDGSFGGWCRGWSRGSVRNGARPKPAHLVPPTTRRPPRIRTRPQVWATGATRARLGRKRQPWRPPDGRPSRVSTETRLRLHLLTLSQGLEVEEHDNDPLQKNESFLSGFS
jgi:hypothetical protein